jgi:hypothetical protein
MFQQEIDGSGYRLEGAPSAAERSPRVVDLVRPIQSHLDEGNGFRVAQEKLREVRGQADTVRNNPDAMPSFRRFNKNLLYEGLVSWQKGLAPGEFRSSLLPASGTGDAINGPEEGGHVRLCERQGRDLGQSALIAVLAR